MMSQVMVGGPQRSLCPARPARFCRPTTQHFLHGLGAVRTVRAAAAAAPRTVTKGRTELQGSHDWTELIRHDGITKPREIPGELRKALIKYGELTQITYDSFYGDAKDASTFGLNKYPPEKLFEEVLLDPNSPLKTFKAVKYFYAESGLPPLRTDFITGRKMNRYWQGYAAVNEPDATGKREVVFAWRGTIAGSEWSMDVQSAMCDYDERRRVGVAEGFSTMWKVSQDRKSPAEQVTAFMGDLYKQYGNEIGSLTVVGHSLGGALAHLCAFHLADEGLNKRPDQSLVPVTAYTFCSPRVGDEDFRKACEALDVKVLRVVNRRDIVPKVPGLSKDELNGRYVGNNDGADGGSFQLLQGFDINDPKKGLAEAKQKVAQRLRDRAMQFGTTVYRNVEKTKSDKYDEVGVELMFDTEEFPNVFKKGGNLVGAAGRAHNLEVILHMVDPQRDPALCNKSEDALVESFGVPPAWHGIPLKGMRLNADGKWQQAYAPYVEPEAAPKDVDESDIEKQGAAQGMKFPDVQGAFNKLPFGFGRKDLAGKK